jgi:hypothetical protein
VSGPGRYAQNAVTAAGSPTYCSTLRTPAVLDGEQGDLRIIERAPVRTGAADLNELVAWSQR